MNIPSTGAAYSRIFS